MSKKPKTKADEKAEPKAKPASSSSNIAPAMDPLLLARLKGELGDQESVGKVLTDFAVAFTEFLPEVFQGDVPFDIEIGYDGFEMGQFDDLITDLGDVFVLCDVSLRGWCNDYVLACSNTFIMIMVEALLGAADDTIEEPEPRPLSKIELELAKMVFDRISGVMRSVITTVGNFEPILSDPYNAANRANRPEGYRDPYGAILNMKFKIGDIEPSFAIIIPQSTILKTTVISTKSNNGPRIKKDWAEQLKGQVERSNIGIEARIKLQELSLNTVSRLQIGDVIPFHDLQDVRVEVKANGKELYVGEFGRSGEKYTVRVKDTYGTEEELLSHLIG